MTPQELQEMVDKKNIFNQHMANLFERIYNTELGIILELGFEIVSLYDKYAPNLHEISNYISNGIGLTIPFEYPISFVMEEKRDGQHINVQIELDKKIYNLVDFLESMTKTTKELVADKFSSIVGKLKGFDLEKEEITWYLLHNHGIALNDKTAPIICSTLFNRGILDLIVLNPGINIFGKVEELTLYNLDTDERYIKDPRKYTILKLRNNRLVQQTRNIRYESLYP